jgi:hypothetical protein
MGQTSKGLEKWRIHRARSAPTKPNFRQLAFAVNDSTLGQIVGRQFHPNFVPRHDADEVLSHSPCNVSHHFGSGF